MGGRSSRGEPAVQSFSIRGERQFLRLAVARRRPDPGRHRVGGYARGRVAHSPAFANGDLVLVNETGHITSFDGLTGLVRWEHEMERDVITEPVAAGNQIIKATNDRRLFAFNSDTGAVAWEYDLVNTNLSTAPAIAGGVLYLPTHDGRLLALR